MPLPSIKEAKESLTIVDIWHMLGLPGQPSKSCKSPFRRDKKPSFSVYDDGRRWKDFSTDEGGDVIDFIAKAKGISTGEACREFHRLAEEKGII